MLGTNVKSAVYAAQFGMGYVFGQFMSDSDGVEAVRRYREEFVPSAGLKEPEVMVAVSAMCAATENDAIHWSMEIASQRKGNRDTNERENNMDTVKGSSQSNSSNKEDKEVQRHVAGTPEQIWQYIRQAGQRLNTNRILVVTAGPDYERRLESYRLLAGLR
jgi:alkanesulfonate monooxygenase SsuD/methylene tetrahydromethanopterin reductase-like flavin-dependent oxidoreductase (luciferase family)